MKTFKKAIGVVLAIAMLTGVFSMMASALAPDTAVDLFIETDKAVYAAGDTIHVTVYEQSDPLIGNMQIGGQYSIGYPSAAVEPYSTSKVLEDHNFVSNQAGYDSSISGVNFWTDTEPMGDYVDASQASLWDESICYVVADDGATNFDCSAKTKLFEVDLKVKATAADGTYTIGFNRGSYAAYIAYSNDTNGGVYGEFDDMGYGVTNAFGWGTCTFTVGATTTMEVNPVPNALSSYGQIRYKLNAAGTDVADTFDVRIMSSITNVAELYANEDEFKADVADVGFIFSASAMTEADAATVAEGGAVSGITKKSLDDQYLQRVTAGSEYKFSCMISDINYSDVNSTVYVYAYVQTTTNGYFYYPAVINVTYSTLYNAYIDAFRSDMGLV